MSVLKVGEVYLPVAGRGEGCFFDIDDAGARLIYCYNRPTAAELADVQSGKPFEIRFMEIGGILWTAHKCGGNSWCDAPYNPRLSLVDAFQDLPGETDGLGLTLIMVDAADGVIRHLRQIGLGHKFSVALLDAAARLRDTPLTMEAYRQTLAEVPRKYSSQQIARMASHYFKLRGDGS